MGYALCDKTTKAVMQYLGGHHPVFNPATHIEVVTDDVDDIRRDKKWDDATGLREATTAEKNTYDDNEKL